MSAATLPVFHIARFILECRTALSIATGFEGLGHDTELVRDANGLPALPGSALAGVLRHLYRREYQGDDALFGYQQGQTGMASRVQVAWGCLLDSQGAPVEGLLIGASAQRLETDSVLRAARASRTLPTLRDRVQLDHRGSAVDGAKFDRAILPAGHRFACEITLHSAHREDICWTQLTDLLEHTLFRLGGATRAGLGAFDLVSLHTANLDLSDAHDAATFRALGPSLGDTRALAPVKTRVPTQQTGLRRGHIVLRPRHFWRIGQGTTPLHRDPDKVPDLLPKLESRLVWKDGTAHTESQWIIVPGSAIKGAIAHRVAFHANRLSGRFAEEPTHWDETTPIAPPEIKALFGEAKDDDSGHAGRVFIDDVSLPETAVKSDVLTHNVIDRFSGGVRNGLLFDEELIWQGEIRIPIVIDERGEPLSKIATQALEAAIDDLCTGRLAIGAGASRGHGFCDGTLCWDTVNEEAQ